MRKLLVLGFALAVTAAALAAGVVLGPGPAESAFPGANGKIAFTSDRDGNPEIYVMNADGSGVTRLTNNPAADDEPAWSPDGTKIAFSSNRDGNIEVYVMNADGSGQTNLTNNPALDGAPAWSPDGTKIAFWSNRDDAGDSEIYVMNADGSGPTRLTNNPASLDGGPAWSPDGSKIAFMRGDRPPIPRYKWDIYVMNPDGSGVTNLSNNPYSPGNPDWSPDGTKITYSAFEAGHDIFVMNADGSGQTNLTNSGASDCVPAWSPDGSKIAFSSNRDGNYEIYVMNPEGSGQTRLTNNAASDTSPDWQPLVYDFTGFFAPVDNTPTLNVAKAGSAIPVKFSLNGDQGLDIFATGYPKSLQIDCDTSASVDGIEQTVTAGSSSLSYDPIADQYVYVWKTDKAWAGTCRQLVAMLNDGTDHVANFKFK